MSRGSAAHCDHDDCVIQVVSTFPHSSSLELLHQQGGRGAKRNRHGHMSIIFSRGSVSMSLSLAAIYLGCTFCMLVNLSIFLFYRSACCIPLCSLALKPWPPNKQQKITLLVLGLVGLAGLVGFIHIHRCSSIFTRLQRSSQIFIDEHTFGRISALGVDAYC